MFELSVMKEAIKTTSYDLEAELPGLGWSKGGCSADSLQGQPKQIYIYLTCKFILSRINKQHLHVCCRHMFAGFTERKSQLQKTTINETIRCMMEMTRRTTYEWEVELAVLGSVIDGS